MIALEQLRDTRHLNGDVVMRAALSGDPRLSSAAIALLSDHGSWAAQAVPVLERWWQQEPNEQEASYVAIVRAWRGQPAIPRLVGRWLATAVQQPGQQPSQRLLNLLDLWRGETLPEALVPSLAMWMRSSPLEAADQLADIRIDGSSGQLLVEAIHAAIQRQPDAPSAVPLVRILPAGEAIARPDVVEHLIDQRDYRLLSRLQLSQEQARQLVSHVETANAIELPNLLTAISSAGSDNVDRGLLNRLYALPVARTLDENALKNAYRQRSPDIQQLAAETSEVLLRAPSNVSRTVEQVLQSLPAGDPVRGLQVFRTTKTSCSACHQMGYIGGKIGPELTSIGRTRTREALLEAILFPSVRIEQSFRPTKVLTVDGQVISGLIVRATADELQLQISAEKQVTLPVEDIQEQQPGDVSIMPTGMLEVLSRQELADLLALLESAR